MIAFARNKGSDRILTVINRGDYDYTYALPYDWRAAKGLMGVMPWEGCLTMPPLSCAVLGLGGWMEQCRTMAAYDNQRSKAIRFHSLFQLFHYLFRILYPVILVYTRSRAAAHG